MHVGAGVDLAENKLRPPNGPLGDFGAVRIATVVV